MKELLLVLAIVVPCLYAYKRSVRFGQVEINHVTTFSFGFLFYWITPLAVRIIAPKVNFPMVSLWTSLFRAHFIVPYALSCIALYVCFALGDSLGLRVFSSPRTEARSTEVPGLALSIVTIGGCVLMVYSAYLLRADLFRAVTPTDIRVGVARGAVTACVVLFSVVALIFTLDHPAECWRRRLRSRYFLPLNAGSLMMILLGSRLYVASILLMFVIYQTNFRSRVKLKTVVLGVLLAAFFFGAVGTWREGSSTREAFFNVFLEPMEGSLSLVHHLRYKGIAWVNAPNQLASDFENLIPTVLMPEKYKMLKKPDAYRPLGGLHSFVSFNLNFGLIGTAVFWFLLPIGLRYLKYRSQLTLPALIYIACSGWLAFTFFRDAFSISLVKAMLEDAIIIPCLIVALGRFLSAACLPIVDSAALAPPSEAT